MPAPIVRLELSYAGSPFSDYAFRERVTDFEFTEEVNEAAQLKVDLDNDDLELLDRLEFWIGSKIKASWGYAEGPQGPPRTMHVDRVKGFSELRIEAISDTGLAHRNKASVGLSDATLDEYIADRAALLPPPVNLPGLRHNITQAAKDTPGKLLEEAGKRGFLLVEKPEGGYTLTKRDLSKAPTRELTYFQNGGNVISVSLDTDIVGKEGLVQLKGRHLPTKTDIDATARAAPQLGKWSVQVDEETATAAEVFSSAEYRGPTTARTQEEAEAHAREQADRNALGAIELTVVIVGDPFLRVADNIRMMGIGRRLSGAYMIHKKKDKIGSSGYTTTLTLKSDGVAVGKGLEGTGPNKKPVGKGGIQLDKDHATGTYQWRQP